MYKRQIAGWQTTQPGVLDWRPRFENYAASTQTAFEKDNGVAGLFIGYYRNQDQQHKMITSTNVLVTTDDPFWAKLGSAKREIEWNRQRLDVRTAELRGPVSARLLVWQWYWVDGRWTASDFLAKAYTVLSRLRGKGDDSAVIILYALPSGTEQADTILQDFARAAAPAIESWPARRRNSRRVAWGCWWLMLVFLRSAPGTQGRTAPGGWRPARGCAALIWRFLGHFR